MTVRKFTELGVLLRLSDADKTPDMHDFFSIL